MKKILSFLSVLMLTILVGVFSVACGDKYKNMYLEVQYLEWQIDDEGNVTHGEWVTVETNSNSENYGLSFMLNDFNKNKANDCYELRMRVLVKGTKKKVDHIYISCPEGELSNTIVSDKQEFVIRFSNTESPYLYVTPSIKSDTAKVEFPIVMYSELDHITANPDYFPAVSKGSDLALNDLTDLIVYHGADEIATNQLGVIYSIDGVQPVDGVYTIGTGASSFSLDTNNNINKIKVGDKFREKSVTLKATSVYYDYIIRDDKSGLSTEVDVKIVDNISSGDINLNYERDFDITNGSKNDSNEINSIALYQDSDKYAETNLVLSVNNAVSYKFKTDGVANDVYYDVDILIFDSEKGYDVNLADYNNRHRGVQVIELPGSENYKKYNIGLYEHSGITENKLKFVVGFDNLKFTGKDYSLEKSVLTYDLTVERADLPNAIFINGDSYRDSDELTGVIYDKYEPGQKGFELNINAVREIQKQTKIIMSATYYGDKVDDGKTYYTIGAYYFNDEAVDTDLTELTNKIYLRFTDTNDPNKQYPNQIDVEFKVLSSPNEFEGKIVPESDKEYIIVTLRLTVSGSLDSVTSTGSDKETNNKLFNTTDEKLIEADKNYVTHIKLVSSGGFNVATETVRISSEKSLISLSKDGKTWVNSIKYSELTDSKLYIKAEKDVSDKLVVSADNGAKFTSTSIKFVETTGNYNPALTFDSTYIYNALEYITITSDEKNKIEDLTCNSDYYEGYSGYYLAMQLSQNADFTLTYNGNKTAGVFYTYATNLTNVDIATMGKNIAAYAVDGVKTTNFSNGYSFNLEGRNNNLITVVKVDYKYYFGTGDSIEIKENTVYLEIAVYAPVNDLVLEATNDEIYYVNELMTERASTSITVTANSTATKNIYFSNSDINDYINSSSKNNTGYIYDILIRSDDYTTIGVLEAGKVDGTHCLDLEKALYTLTLTKDILESGESEKELKISFIVESQLGYSRTFTKILRVTRHIKVEGIQVSGTYDNNVYLSLLSDKDKVATFGARVTNLNATYSDLKYELYEYDELNVNGKHKGEQIFSNEKLGVSIDNSEHVVTLTANASEGGMFILKLIAPDSYSDADADYLIYKDVVITISDGSVSSPYYLRTLTDVTNIKNAPDKHYVLASNINLSELKESIASEFSGSLNGVICVYNPATNTNVYSQYKFTNVNITDGYKMEDKNLYAYNYGLFGKVTGTISNLVLDKVTFKDFKVTGESASYNFNLGALAGMVTDGGKIINCSATVLGSNITLENHAYKAINIGVLVGENNGTINYYDQENKVNKKYASTIQAVEYNKDKALEVYVNTASDDTVINFGGLIGINKSILKANYFDFDESLFKEYLTANVNMWINISSNINTGYTANVGGIAGNNEGTISQVCVTGVVKGSGNKIAIGGIVGLNANTLKDSASYTTNVSGLAYVSETNTQSEIKEQFVGGAVGTLDGTTENVNVIFVDLENQGYNSKALVKGVCVVGGLVGRATSGTITNGNVQSFINDSVIVGDFTANTNNTTCKLLGGLIGNDKGCTTSTSFVSANIEVKDPIKVDTLTSGNITNAYFVGEVKIFANNEWKNLDTDDENFARMFNINSSKTVYSLVFGYEYTSESTNRTYEYGILYFNNGANGYYYADGKCWISGTSVFENQEIVSVESPSLSGLDSDIWSTKSDYTNYNYGLPVLKVDGKETMIALPEELNADVSDKEFNNTATSSIVYQNDNGIFISDGKGNNSGIVFLSDRTYNLVSLNGEVGLIEKEVLPTIASGQYYVRIISGSDICTLSGNTIKFVKTGRIELEFISLFNNEAKDRVVLYVENAINSFEILNGGRVIDKLSTQTNINKLLEFNALFNGVDSKINLQNLFLHYELDCNESVAETNPLGNVKDKVNGYYSFDDLQLQIKDIDTNNKTVKLKVSMYLNLANYIFGYENNDDGSVTAVTYQYVFGVNKVLIKEITLDIDIYQSATSLIIDTAEQNLPSSKDSFITFDIISSFVQGDASGYENFNTQGMTSNYLYTSLIGTETFYCLISSEHEADWFKEYKIKSLWSLFDVSYTYSKLDDKGYTYVLYFELKEQYKAITRDEVFEFKFVSITNDSAFDTTTVTYTPQQVTSLRIENFKSGVVSILDNGKVEYESNETHSSIIVPGKNGLIKIYVEPSFASVDMVEISSSEILVNGVPYVVRFQQMLYDTNLKHYVSYPGYTTENNTLKLQKNSYINDKGELVYTGVIYVRTILEKLIGVSQTFEITVNTYTYVRDEDGNYDKNAPVIDESRTKTTTKYLQTDYNPGVSLSVSNLLEGQIDDGTTKTDVYLIEKNSNNAVVYAQIYGYHINQQPQISFNWVKNLDKDETNNIGLFIYDYVNYAIGVATRQSDGSYIIPIYITTKNLTEAIQMSMSLSLISEGTTNTSKSDTRTFYPVDYIPTGVYLKDVGNNYATLNVNSSMFFDFVWMSAGQELNSNEINAKLFENDEATYLNCLYTNSYNTSGVLQENYLSLGEFTTYKISADNNAKKYVITALGEGAISITLSVRYSYIYENGRFIIKFFPTLGSNEGDYSIKYTFTIRFNVATTEATATPIWTAEQFKQMSAGGNYILMSDITLTDWAPMDATFASLDGNGKLIKLTNFAVPTGEAINAGLFSAVSSNTILKNVVVDISSCETSIMLADANTVTGDTNFGFIAGVNNGIIYNSEVISLTSLERTITVKTSSTKSYIGLFVGKNNGIITNSRVGTPYFEKITVKENGSTESKADPTGLFTVKASGIVAGFVAENSGTISSSYFNNANLINTHIVGSDDVNMTAGFVANNTTNGSIYGSYAKGKGITSTNVRGLNSGVSNTGAGSSAGFVFENSGLIENSYSNLRVESSSFGVAGFVYNNTSSGVIKQSYSASKVTSSSTNVSLAVELPFVGVDILNKLQSYGTLENCYYLELSDDAYDKNYLFNADMDMPISLNKTNFAISDSLLNFAFVDGNYSQAVQGIWTYFATLDKNDGNTYKLGKTALPELTSANQIARSIRYIEEKVAEDGEVEHVLIYANGYNQGSTNNPYIIRDYNEYNSVFNYNKEDTRFNSFTGNVRLINNIDFTLTNNDTATINTTLGFTLGDKNNQTLTVVDGNGMTISGVDTKNNEQIEQNSLGLFNNIEYSIVKNMNIEFTAMNYTSTRAMYSGGLAGTINNSHIIGLDLIGDDTTISAFNFAGGLAGIITGDSGAYNVTSNLSVKVGKENLLKYYQYISKDKFDRTYSSLGYTFSNVDTDKDGDIDNDDRYLQYLSQLSYAGGLSGVLDFNTNGDYSSVYNLNKVTIGQDTAVSVVADIAGFVVGYIGRGVSANRLKAVITNDSFVEGAYIVGGLIGEHYGKVRYSQVAYLDNSSYDTAFANYILDKNISALDNSNSAYGTLNFVRSTTEVEKYKNIAGGFIGVNYGGYVDNSYTKANITANANYIGGFIGVNYDGTLNSVYAQNYIDWSTLQSVNKPDNRTEKIGGLIAVNAKSNVTDSISRVYKLNNYANIDSGLEADTIVTATFFDKTQLISHYENIIEEDKQVAKNVKIDYLIAESNNTVSSSQGSAIPSYYVYYLKYGTVGENNDDYSYKYYADYVDKNIENNNDISADEKEDRLGIWQNLITRGASIPTDSNGGDIFAVAEDITNLYDLNYDKQEEVFTTLFLSYDMTVWEKDNTKYFPTLKENPTINFYEINTEADLLLMILYPDANFVLNGDIELSSERVNYVLDIAFTGMFIGRADDNGNNPTISGIKLYSDGKTDTAGFFRQTGSEGNGAIISNINFEYDYFVANNSKDENNPDDKNIDTVGLLSPVDQGSEISGVKITANKIPEGGKIVYSAGTIKSSSVNNCTVVTDSDQGATITNFGGLIGDAQGSNIINCNANVNAYIKSQNEVTSNVGGLVGKSIRYIEDDSDDENEVGDSTIILNSGFTGELYLTNADYVGGIVGHANKTTTITGGKTSMTVTNDSTSAYYIGGVIGLQQESYVEDTLSTLTVKTGTTASATNVGHYIGGISGYVDNSKSIAGVIGAMATVNMDNFEENIGMIAVGGIYGLATKCVMIEDSIAWSYGSISKAESVRFGGLVGVVDSKATLIHIDNCLAYIEGVEDASGLKLSANLNIKAGGLIASIENAGAVVSITNSSTSGAIWPESAGGVSISAGGLIGEWAEEGETVNLESCTQEKDENGTPLYSTNITNCYTTLMFETSKFKIGSSNTFNVSAFIGYIPNNYSGKIYSSDLYYSSDFTLCLEEKEIFTTMPVDLAAQAMLLSYQKEKFFTEGWETIGGGLPYRTSLSTKLAAITNGVDSILTRYTNFNGYSLNPYRPDSLTGKIEDSTTYKYHFVYKDTSANQIFAVSGSFKGVILGGGKEVNYERLSVGETLTLEEHSVLSNLKVTIPDEEVKDIVENGNKEFSFVSVNNGTIFNVYLDYFYKPVGENTGSGQYTITSGGGIVSTNNGTMLYCFNAGNLEEVITDTFAGIATYNSGYIAHSGFVGTLTSPAGVLNTHIAGFCYNNEEEGTIYNCYSAGVITSSKSSGNVYHSTFIKNNSGILENCYYDKYANAEYDEIKNEQEGTLLHAVTTSDLQNGGSGLVGNWSYYLMTINEDLVSQKSYNYGYPIYVLKQQYGYKDSVTTEKKDFEFKGLETGSGNDGDPYLVNHLGTVGLVDDLITEKTKDVPLRIKLVNDIDANKNKLDYSKINAEIMENWQGLGTKYPFIGSFISGDRKPQSKTVTNNEIEFVLPTNSVRYINNLNGNSGLFKAVGSGAEIGSLAFGSAIIANGSAAGVLANEVKTDGVNIVSIYDILLSVGDRANMSISAKDVGGLIGLVSGTDTNNNSAPGGLSLTSINLYNDVDIYGVKTDNIATFDLYSTSSATNLGSVIGATNGNVTVDINGLQFSMNSRIGFTVNKDNEIANINANNVGGLIGSVGNGSTININTISITEGTEGEEGDITGKINIGGFIGVIDGGTVKFNQTDGLDLSLSLGHSEAVNVGGFVGAMVGGEININTGTESTIAIQKIEALTYAGGIVGLMSGGTITCEQEELCKVEINSLLTTSGSIGGIVGTMTNKTNDNGTTSCPAIYGFDVKFNEGTDKYKATAFGGVVGTLVSGNIGYYSNEGSKETAYPIKVSGDVSLTTGAYVGTIAGKIVPSKDVATDKVTLVNVQSEMKISIESGTGASDTGLGGIAGVIEGNSSSSITFGKVTLNGIKLEAKKDFKNVGGLFGRLATTNLNTTENNAEIKISGLEVLGTFNVGGFAGLYNQDGMLSVNKGFANFLSSEGIATVGIANVEEPNGNAENFGGLFGTYAYEELLYLDLGESEADKNKKPFVNNNNVLNEITSEAFSLFGDKNRLKHEIINVGGIAGLLEVSSAVTLQGENKGAIGSGYENGDDKKYSELTDRNYLSEDTQKAIMNMRNVGGIVGAISYVGTATADTDTTTEPDSGTDTEPESGTESTTTSPIVKIENATNSGTINGYTHIGGLIGLNEKMDISMVSATVGGKVYGRSYLGGITSKITTTLNWNVEDSTKVKLDKVNLSGYSYIGGIAAVIESTEARTLADDNVNLIGKLTATGVEINGLINIGGLVASITGPKSESLFVIDGSGSSLDIAITGNTNVGGIAGIAKSNIIIRHFETLETNINLIEYKYASSDDLGAEKDIYYKPTSVGGIVGYLNGKVEIRNSTPTGNITSETISQELSAVNNYVVGSGETAYASGKYNGDEYESSVNDNLKSYEAIKTGIGGLIGTADNAGAEINRSTSDINIYAPTGFNVGGVAGYYKLETKDSILDLSKYNNSNLTSEGVYIAGGMGVGTLFGYLYSTNAIAAQNILERNYTTYLQRRLLDDDTTESVQGMYVGGLIGRSTTINGLNLTESAQIFVDNSKGSAYGGLVGWLDGNMAGAENVGGVTFLDNTTINYGGLVGAINVKDSIITSDDTEDMDLTITGKHLEYFTVDTVNMYYDNGNKVFGSSQKIDIDEANKMIYLINNLTMNGLVEISASAISLDYNPVRFTKNVDGVGVKTYGWAKEYTMFRQIDYVYEVEGQTQTRQAVYNAEYVTEVSRFTNETIHYTIYDDGKNPILYSKYGVAELLAENISENEQSNLEKILLTKLAESYGFTYEDMFREDVVLGEDYRISRGNQSRVFVRVSQLGIGSHSILNMGNKNVGSWGFAADARNHNYAAFYNFRSEAIMLSYIEDEGLINGLKEFKDKFTSLNYYLIKGFGEKYKYSFFKYSNVYADFPEELKTKNIDGSNGLFSYDSPEVTRFDPNCGLLFNILQNLGVGGRLPSNYTKPGFLGIGTIKEKLNLSLSNSISKHALDTAEEVALSYLLNMYEGQYGFISDMYYREGRFNGSKLGMTSDNVIEIMTDINGGARQAKVLYYYYSTTQPADFGEDITITSEQELYYPRYTGYKPASGDVMPKYQRVGYEYYISCYALNYSDYTVTFDNALKDLDTDLPYFYFTEDGDYYVINDSIIENDPYKLSLENVNESLSIGATLGFVYDPEYIASGLEGYDYVKVSTESRNKIYWKLVEYNENYQVRLKLYYNPETSAYIGIGDGALVDQTTHCLIPVISSAEATNIVNDLENHKVYSTNFGVETFVGYALNNDEYYTTDVLRNTPIITVNESILDSDIYLKYSGRRNVSYTKDVGTVVEYKGLPENPEENGYFTKEINYYYYSNVGGSWYDKTKLVDVGNKTPVYQIVDPTAITVYKGSNYEEVLLNTIDVSNRTDTINDLSYMDGYYYKNKDGSYSPLSELYKYTGSDWAIRRYGYYAYINNNGIIKIKQIELLPEGEFYENRTSFKVDNCTIYTRYVYNADTLQKNNQEAWNTFISKLPTSGSGNMGGYNIAEIAMFSFNTYDGEKQTSGFVCADSEKAYEITFELSGGTFGNNNPNKAFYADTSDFTVYEPTKSGYTFAGWYTDQSYQNYFVTKSHVGNLMTLDLSGIYNDITLYAKWTEDTSTE